MYCQNFMVGVIGKKKISEDFVNRGGKAIMKKMFAKHCGNPFGECKLKAKTEDGTFRKWKPRALI